MAALFKVIFKSFLFYITPFLIINFTAHFLINFCSYIIGFFYLFHYCGIGCNFIEDFRENLNGNGRGFSKYILGGF